MTNELSQDAPQAAEPTLRDQIARVVWECGQDSVERPWRPEWVDQDRPPAADNAFDTADLIMTLLHDEGHVVPGAPPAAQILADARDFAERLTITTLALRLLNMLAYLTVATPETKPARRWLDDYLEGRNHGPVGKPMLWPAQLPGIANLLRDWGFMPTPTVPAFVAKAPPVTVIDAPRSAD